MGNSASEFENADHVELTAETALNVFGDQYCNPQPRDLVMKEKCFSFSGDDFTISDTNETPLFQLHGKTFSLRDSKKLKNMDGSVIGGIKEKKLTAHRRMYIVDANDMVRVVVRKSSFFQLAACAEAWILKEPLSMDQINKIESKTRPADIRMGGNWRSKNFIFALTNGNHVIGKTQRKGMTMRGLLAGKDTYYVQVPAYVDAALLLLLTVTVDEIFRDDK